MAASKKFNKIEIEDPALNYITTAKKDATLPENAPDPKDTPEGYKLNPEYVAKYIERRTKRECIILQPTVVKNAKEKARNMGISFNEYIHRLIIADLQGDR